MYVCTYVYSGGGPQSALALRPFLRYCASPLISPLLIPHYKRLNLVYVPANSYLQTAASAIELDTARVKHCTHHVPADNSYLIAQ
jgi:hypothetical protein